MTFDQQIDSFFKPIAQFAESVAFFTVPVGGGQSIPFVLIWLIAGAAFFTVYFKFPNIRLFKLSLNVVRGVYTNPNDKGEVSHFQALATALSGTVGLGNIAGVAIAITTGGPGATFWMIIAGLLGMSSKFVECSLGVKYRKINDDGSVSGGPMYYLDKGLAKIGWSGTGKFLAFFFAMMCVGGSFGGGNMFQANQAFQQFVNITGGQASMFADLGWLFGIVLALLVGVVIIGGIHSIANVTDKLVPLMCGIYVLAALVIIGLHIDRVPEMFGTIFHSAFTGEAVAGGILGSLIAGFRRAAFSNEAGIGSASIAHSAVKTNEHVSEGVVALLEPFIDTVVICTMTALVIIITDMHTRTDVKEGIYLTSLAFGEIISWFPIVLSFAVIMFAYSTMISWSYYGLKAWTFIFGDSKASDYSYKFLFLFHVVVGSSASLGSVVNFSDAMIFLMAFPNVAGMLILAPELRKDVASYVSRIASGALPRYK